MFKNVEQFIFTKTRFLDISTIYMTQSVFYFYHQFHFPYIAIECLDASRYRLQNLDLSEEAFQNTLK